MFSLGPTMVSNNNNSIILVGKCFVYFIRSISFLYSFTVGQMRRISKLCSHLRFPPRETVCNWVSWYCSVLGISRTLLWTVCQKAIQFTRDGMFGVLGFLVVRRYQGDSISCDVPQSSFWQGTDDHKAPERNEGNDS